MTIQEHATVTFGRTPTPPSGSTLVPEEYEKGFSLKVPRTTSVMKGTGELTDKVHWEIGDVIDGKYQVLEVIGQGGMSIVYKIRHLEWNLHLAVKVPLPHLLANRSITQQFVHEAQAWVELGFYPNIVQCWYVRELGGIPRVFMDYVRGGSLRDWITSGKVTPGQWDVILDCIIQACYGLNYAHRMGILAHRDIKPENLMLTTEGNLLITDFGLARQKTETDSNVFRSLVGTPEYGAPEQWTSTAAVDARADIYALGCVLFELCCGRRPFDDGSHHEPPQVLIERQLTLPAPDPRKFNQKIPHKLVEIILSCLAKSPAERPGTVSILREKLTRIYGELVGTSYKHPLPQAVELRADALNNRAVSFLDLGKEQEAFSVWKEALKLDTYHPESIYNMALLEWRASKITDEDAIKRLAVVERVSRRARLYLGYLHLERAAADEAEEQLMDALNDPDLAKQGRILRALGNARMAQQKYGAAEAAYLQALDLNPGDSKALEPLKLAQAKTREQDGTIAFPWRHCLRGLENGHKGAVTAVVITPDGRFVVSGSRDTTIRIWERATGIAIHILTGHEEMITALAMTPDGQFLISGSRDMTVCVWELESGKRCWIFRGHTSWVTDVAVTPDGAGVVSGSRDKTLRLWDVKTGECRWISEEQTHWINAVAVTPDGRYAISGHDEDTLYLWDLATGQRVERTFFGPSWNETGLTSSTISTLAILPDGQQVVTGNSHGHIQIWHLETGEMQRTLDGHEEAVTSLAITPDGRFMLSGSHDASIRFWNIKTGECLWSAEEHRDSVLAIAVSPDGGTLLSGSRDATIRQWKADTGECLVTFWGYQGHKEGVTAVAIAMHGRFALSGSRDRTLRLWDLNTLRCLRVFEGHEKGVTSLCVILEGRYAVSGSRDSQLRLWELGTGACLRLFAGHKAEVTSVVTTPNGHFVISGSADKTIRLWNIETARCLRIFEGHQQGITAVAVSPDERYIISASRDTTIRVWDRKTAACLRVFKGHQEQVTTIAVTPNGRFVVSGSQDMTLKLWDIETAVCLRTFTGHHAAVTAVVVSSDGHCLISGGQDQTLRLWDIATTRCLRTFQGHHETISSLVITPDGHYLLSGSDDCSIRIWDLDSRATPQEAAISVCRQHCHEEVLSYAERFRKLMVWAEAALQTGKTTTACTYLQQARQISGFEHHPDALTLNATLCQVLPRKRVLGEWVRWTFEGHDDDITSLAITPNGRFAISASQDMTLRLWDVSDTQYKQMYDEHLLGVTSVAVTPDGQFMVSGSEDRTLRLWSLKSGKCLRVYGYHEDDVTAVGVTPCGRFFVSGSADQTLRVWNPSTTKSVRIFTGHTNGVTAFAISQDNQYIMSASQDRSLRLWDRTGGKCLQIFHGHRNSVTAVNLSPSGRFAVSGSEDGTLRLWNVSSGACLRLFTGHMDGVTAVILSPDARFAFSASHDHTIRLWDLVTGNCLRTFEEQAHGVNALAITPDGRFLLSGGADRLVTFRELDWELDVKGTRQNPTQAYKLDSDAINMNTFSRLTAIFKYPSKPKSNSS